MEFLGEMIIHAREGCECHFAEVYLSLYIIEVNTHLWKTLPYLFGYFYHYILLYHNKSYKLQKGSKFKI